MLKEKEQKDSSENNGMCKYGVPDEELSEETLWFNKKEDVKNDNEKMHNNSKASK